MTLTPEQIRLYFEHRHPGQRIQPRSRVSVKCAFHDDRTPSCTFSSTVPAAFIAMGVVLAGTYSSLRRDFRTARCPRPRSTFRL